VIEDNDTKINFVTTQDQIVGTVPCACPSGCQREPCGEAETLRLGADPRRTGARHCPYGEKATCEIASLSGLELSLKAWPNDS